ncbi:MAG TPA: bifunctional proline dehydrogenase/L-glutamate gamma-semialdehyde dehydrogenase PutA [Caulobacteraceae bacterium]
MHLPHNTSLDEARTAVAAHYRVAEGEALEALAVTARPTPAARERVAARARALLAALRAPGQAGWVDQFLQEYSLSSQEGAALLGLAEAYLRIPDAGTSDALIRDKIGAGDWRAHVGSTDSLMVNGATLGLIVAQSLSEASDKTGTLRGLVGRLGEPAVRAAVAAAMQTMGQAFVLGRDMGEALRRADRGANRAYRYSFDMLGEAARTIEDADAYFASYLAAIGEVAKAAHGPGDVLSRDNVSVKLSALHPRYEPFQADRAVPHLISRLVELAGAAKAGGVGLTVDAEESERLEMSLSIIEGAARDPRLKGWDGLGMAVQAYQKRGPAVIAWSGALARATGRRLMVRLVKGAYWDSEIKRCQEMGLLDYPVFTRKTATDVSYVACAAAMLDDPSLFPAFATHNALTVATVLERAGIRRDFEFQRLHGMGEGLYRELMGRDGVAVRVYAPVGGYRDLLAYLVRRLLENGANTSFVHQIADSRVSDDALLADPIEAAQRSSYSSHPAIPKPPDLFAPARRNSEGLDLSDAAAVDRLIVSVKTAWPARPTSGPIVGGEEQGGPPSQVFDPADDRNIVGEAAEATTQDVNRAIDLAQTAQAAWNARGADQRSSVLERLADLIERDRAALMGLAISEAGKTIADALGEVREAVDFCRYYAMEARRHAGPISLPGPTGELNELSLAGRGVFACISPWNFPLSIFLGQVAAALAMGNSVVAKPAPQTPLIAAAAVRLAFEAGVPADVLHLVPGPAAIGEALVADHRIAGVAFTGSTATARAIARALLADERRPLVPLIAETGGINAMLVDSSALPEQVVGDVITSAFMSAGQRCSALRLLCLHEDIAPAVQRMLFGAMDTLVLGSPIERRTDIGPVIDADAGDRLRAHLARWKDHILHACPLPIFEHGQFIAPTVIGLPAIDALDSEVFGPILHVVTWKAGALEETLRAINRAGYGLTLGLHSRIGSVAAAVRAGAQVGNLYVNRSMIGAVVGVQPFGGERLSGTGPKAGGPHYLPRFAVERTYTVDTTSAGGNASLLSLAD